MRTSALAVTVVTLLAAIRCANAQNVPEARATEPIVGLPCEGCEAIFEGLPDTLTSIARLAPVGEGETGVDLLRLLEDLACVLVLEAVEQENRPDKGLLRLGRTGVREIDVAEIRGAGPREARQDQHDQEPGETVSELHVGTPSLDSVFMMLPQIGLSWKG